MRRKTVLLNLTRDVYSSKKSELEMKIKDAETSLFAYQNEKNKDAIEIDALINEKVAKELKEVEEASARFKWISVAFVGDDTLKLSPDTRTFKPVKYFSDLQSFVEAQNKDFHVSLTIPGTNNRVGNQEELLYAYESAPEGNVLKLDLKLNVNTKKTFKDDENMKRKLDKVGLEAETDIPSLTHKGKWLASEAALFASGVKQYGWGKWELVADVVETRNAKQVTAFSLTQIAKRFKVSDSRRIIDGALDLASSLKNVSEVLRDSNESILIEKE
jgi:hypothetical protein